MSVNADDIMRELEVEARLAGRIAVIIEREIALRFERELRKEIADAVTRQCPGLMQTYGLVPLPDIDAAVRRCVQSVISERLTALIGVGSITIGAPMEKR